jgi:hypothetical protein
MAVRARRVAGGWIAPSASAADVRELERPVREHPYTEERTTTTQFYMATDGGGNGAGAAGMGGGGGGQDYSYIGDMVEQGRDGWYASVLDQQKQLGNDPCQFRLAIYQTWEQFGRGPLRAVLAVSGEVSNTLQLAVHRSLGKWGYEDDNYINSQGFGLYLLEHGIVDLQLAQSLIFWAFGGPPAGAVALVIFASQTNANLSNRLGVPGKRPSGREYGLEISPGAYLYDPSGTTYDDDLARGKLQGPAVRDAYRAWKSQTVRNVDPRAFPNARNMLSRWVGGDPERWYVWTEGQRITDTSKAGQMLKAEAEMWEMEARTDLECKRQRDWLEKQAVAERIARERMLTAEGERELSGDRERLLAIVAVGAFAAWSFKR